MPAASAARAASAALPWGVDSCASLSDRAHAVDLKAAQAQSRQAPPAALATLLDEALAAWQAAVSACDARPRERAERNLADTRRLRASISEALASGEPCEAAQRDAGALQALGREAIAGRRWPEAASMFRKADSMWEVAGERCTGSRADTAQQHRAEASVDAHNAEFCAQPFDAAREATQRFRAAAPGLPPAQRQEPSQLIETQWRQLATACRGAAQDVARTMADGVQRERGTPWRASGAASPMASAIARAPGPATAGERSGANGAPAAAPPSPAIVDSVLDDGTRFVGRISPDPGGKTQSGEGRIEWPNGDRYEGELRLGVRQGKGSFTWANGQQFSGEWQRDKPNGRGVMRFADRNVYEGGLIDGEATGSGVLTMVNGDVYRGELLSGKPHGSGLYVWADGGRCQCRWTAGVAEGPGELRFANGLHYTGGLRQGVPDGDGEMRHPSGDVYRGRFRSGRSEGVGRYEWVGGDVYQGEWNAGLKEGQGTFTWRGGDRWTGRFLRDERTGDGELVRKTP